jgi:hypothetical protein
MKRKIQYFIFVLPFYLCGIFVALTGGCAARTTTVTNLPPNVTQTEVQRWDSAVANLDKIAQTVSTLRQLTQALCSATVTTPSGTGPVLATGTCDLLLTDIGKIDQAEIAAAGVLQAVPNTWGASTTSQIAQYTQIITAALSDITANGLAGIKNPTAVAQVQSFLATISGAVTIIEAL